MSGRARYSDEEKATALAALDANGGNIARTARALGIPDSTLRGWAGGRGVNEKIPQLRAQKKRDIAEGLREIAWLLIDAIPDKINRGSLKDLFLGLGIAIDKLQLLEGKPTERTEQSGRVQVNVRYVDQAGEMRPELPWQESDAFLQ